jgi:uncharacterized protein YciI
MLFAILGRDMPNSAELRRQARPEHLKRLYQLRDEGRLVLAGPHPAVASPEPGPAGFTGSLIVAEFDSLEAAREWALQDPYATQGVFADVQVLPFIQSLP